jgi:phage-related protein
MANAIGLAMQITANTSGLASSLSEADKLIGKLGQGAVQAAKAFDSFRDSSGNLPPTMQTIVDQAGFLADAFRGGAASAEEFKAGISGIAANASEISAIFQAGAATTAAYTTEEERAANKLAEVEKQYAAGAISAEILARAKADLTGETARLAAEEAAAAAATAAAASADARAKADAAATTAKYATEEEKRAAAIERVSAQRQSGLITEETYLRAMEELSGAAAEAAASEEEAAKVRSRAAAITASVITPQEKYASQVDELDALLAKGAISQETYNRALERAKSDFDKAAASADKFGKEAASAPAGLQFNELSGILGILPGQFGGVAARVSSFASAAEGLGKVIGPGGGGLTAITSALGPQIAALANPVGLAVAGFAAFGAAASAVVSGLTSLSDRVEKLGFQADKLGTSFEFMQVLETAAKRSGSSVEAVGASFNKMLRALDSAKEGSDKSAAAFERLGVSSEELKTLTPEQIFKRVSTELTKIEDPAKRSAAAMAIFGRAGNELIPTFKALPEAEKDLKRFAATLTDLEKVRLDKVDSSFEKLETSGLALSQSLLTPFAGITSGITAGLAEFTSGITAIVQPIGQVLEPVLSNLGAFVQNLLATLGGVGRVIGAVFAPLGEVFNALGGALDPLRETWVSFNQTVIDSVVSATEFVMSFTPIGVIADNIESLKGAFDQAYSAFEPVIASLSEGFSGAGEIASRIAVIIQTAFEKLRESIAGSIGRLVTIVYEGVAAFNEWTGVAAVVSAFSDSVVDSFNRIRDGIKSATTSVGEFIGNAVEFAENWLGIKRDVETPIEAQVQINTEEIESASETSQKYYKEISAAVDQASKLGQDGVDAAVQYQAALQEINLLVREGTYSQEEAQRAAANARAEFDKQIGSIQASQEASRKAAEERQKQAEKQIESDRRVADAFVESQKGQDTKDREKSLETVEAITRSIAATEAEIAAAREAGDRESLNAATSRLQVLEQAQAAAQEKLAFGFTTAEADKTIEDVRAKLEKEISAADIELAPDAAREFFSTIDDLEQQLDLKLIDPKQFEEAAAEAKKLFDEQKKQAEKIRDLQIKYNEQAMEIEAERIAALAKISDQPVKATDVRTSEGASEILRIATGREDPAVAEYRKQTQKLDEIKKEIAKIGGTVEMV